MVQSSITTIGSPRLWVKRLHRCHQIVTFKNWTKSNGYTFFSWVYQYKVEQRLTKFLIQYLLNINKMSISHGQDASNLKLKTRLMWNCLALFTICNLIGTQSFKSHNLSDQGRKRARIAVKASLPIIIYIICWPYKSL